MRKKISLGLMLALVMLGICGCGSKEKDSTTSANPVEPYAEQIEDVNNQVSEELNEMENVMDNLEDY